jgi:hypothetical protein
VSRLVESPADMLGQINRYLQSGGYTGTPQVGQGTLNPSNALVTGYSFLADGAKSVHDNLLSQFAPGLSTIDSIGGHLSINTPVVPPTPPVPPWTAGDARSGFLANAGAASIGALNGHYNHYELEAADNSLATTADVSAALAARILFTMGCHGGLNVADSLGATSGAANKLLDWPQLYSTKQAAIYIANTGFGYGDSASNALSERLLSLYAKNLHSDSNSVGEEWVATLQQYFATAGAYDVYDEKVMEETTFYGLPFWKLGGTPVPPPTYTPPATVPDSTAGNTLSATFSFPTGAIAQDQFGLYRPILPLRSQEVTTSAGPASGLWINSLQTSDAAATATPGYPTIDQTEHEPKPHVQPIFFPASPFTLEHSIVFGKQRDYVNVSDQFRPGSSGDTQRHVVSASLEVFYADSADVNPPLISLVNVSYDATSHTATVQARVTDDSGSVLKVAALVNDGSWQYVRLTPTSDPTLFSGTAGDGTTGHPALVRDPEVFVEATDGINVAYSANKGSNFTSASSAPTGPQILLQAPVGPYAPNEVVNATYQCLPAASVTQCDGTVANNSPIDTSTFGVHRFVVQAKDSTGQTSSLQRDYTVAYKFKGFFQPVDNQPVLNLAKASSGIPVSFSLTGNQGMNIFFDSSYPKSQAIGCDSGAPLDGIETIDTAGSSSLTYSAGNDQYKYVWKTDSSWSGSCRTLILRTKDGVIHRADFKFK